MVDDDDEAAGDDNAAPSVIDDDDEMQAFDDDAHAIIGDASLSASSSPHSFSIGVANNHDDADADEGVHSPSAQYSSDDDDDDNHDVIDRDGDGDGDLVAQSDHENDVECDVDALPLGNAAPNDIVDKVGDVDKGGRRRNQFDLDRVVGASTLRKYLADLMAVVDDNNVSNKAAAAMFETHRNYMPQGKELPTFAQALALATHQSPHKGRHYVTCVNDCAVHPVTIEDMMSEDAKLPSNNALKKLKLQSCPVVNKWAIDNQGKKQLVACGQPYADKNGKWRRVSDARHTVATAAAAAAVHDMQSLDAMLMLRVGARTVAFGVGCCCCRDV
jgi:hypothetical protein